MDDTTTTILLTALVTTLGTALVTWIGHKLSAEKDTTTIENERLRHAGYLAIRVVTVLDAFVIGCTEVLADEGTESDHWVYPTAIYPDIVYPDDVDWRSISPSLTYRLLAMPNALASARRAIDFVGEHVTQLPDNHALFEAQNYHFSKLGLMALDLVDSMRLGFEIPSIDPVTYSSPRSLFERHTVDEDRRRRNAMASIENLIEGARSN